MNSFSYGKCWNFGIMAKAEYNLPWLDFVKTKAWIDFKQRREITDNQIFYIKKGYLGKPFAAEPEFADKEHPNAMDEEIFPFGAYKGSKFGTLSNKYVLWLSEQSWLDKWPQVAVYVKRRIQTIHDSTLSKDEVKRLLAL